MGSLGDYFYVATMAGTEIGMGDRMRTLARTGGGLAILLLAIPATAKEHLGEGVAFVQVVGGDAANPAILDTKGKYASNLLFSAEEMGKTERGGEVVYWAKLKPKLHKKERVCETGLAHVYETSAGKLITKSFRFYDAIANATGAASCPTKEPTDYILAPTLDHYLTARWAMRVLQEPLIAAFGTKDDPFCQPQLLDGCPSREDYETRIKEARPSWIKSCGANMPNCVDLHVFFIIRRNGQPWGGQSRDFRIAFRRDDADDRQLKNFSFKILPPAVLAPRPGPPRIITNNSVEERE